MGHTNMVIAQSVSDSLSKVKRYTHKDISLRDARGQWRMRDMNCKPYTAINGDFTFKSRHDWSVIVNIKMNWFYITYEPITFMTVRDECPF